MNIVAHNHHSSELLSSNVSHFIEEFHVGKLLKACNAYKIRGFSVKDRECIINCVSKKTAV